MHFCGLFIFHYLWQAQRWPSFTSSTTRGAIFEIDHFFSSLQFRQDFMIPLLSLSRTSLSCLEAEFTYCKRPLQHITVILFGQRTAVT